MSSEANLLDWYLPAFAVESSHPSKFSHGVMLVFSMFLAYILAGGIYRVYFSPLAKFPGPFLAGLNVWYNTYYDVWKRGEYFQKTKQLHKEYGPILRIAPNEIHVEDPSFMDLLYTGSSKRRDKIPDSVAGTMPHDLHRRRRAVLNPFFSKQSIKRLEPIIHVALDAVLNRMEEYKRQGKVFPTNLAYHAITADVITHYCFGNSTEYVKRSDWNAPYFDATAENLEMAHYYIHFWPFGRLLDSLPTAIKTALFPGLKSHFHLNSQLNRQIREMRAAGPDQMRTDIVFHGLLFGNLPESEKSTNRLDQEARLLIFAGQDTTARTLSSTTFEILNNPRILRKLKDELKDAIPDPSQLPTCAQVETLPYLSAVIQESLRVHPGAIGRLPRVLPDDSIVYEDNTPRGGGKKWSIPPQTTISMDCTPIHMNADIFESPEEFRPERWIEDPRLDRYLLTFGRGSRACLGVNLAYQELYLVLAGIFRRYDLFDPTVKEDQGPTLELYDTIKERDVDGVAEFIVPFTTKNSKGVQLLVR